MGGKEQPTTQFLAGFLFGVLATIAAYYLSEDTTVTRLIGQKLL
jgi:hypothetical protein